MLLWQAVLHTYRNATRSVAVALVNSRKAPHISGGCVVCRRLVWRTSLTDDPARENRKGGRDTA